MVKEIACNWKIFWENYNECLHCPGIHPELSDMVPVFGSGYMAPNEDPNWTPGTPMPASPAQRGRQDLDTNGALCGPEFPGLTQRRANGGTGFRDLVADDVHYRPC